jgi:GrpB-like predicted nucleotidyltransferase (UPF0157 family)
MRKVEVVSHNPKWQEAFEIESKYVANVLGENVVAIHHIGSTAIPGIYAKPVIDLLVEVKDIIKVDEQSLGMGTLGYEVMGEFGISGRRFFLKNSHGGIRTHHIHIFEAVSEQVERHLAFRDYLIAHPYEAERYSELKRRLAREYPTSIDGYMDGKKDFIETMDKKAKQWRTLAIE